MLEQRRIENLVKKQKVNETEDTDHGNKVEQCGESLYMETEIGKHESFQPLPWHEEEKETEQPTEIGTNELKKINPKFNSSEYLDYSPERDSWVKQHFNSALICNTGTSCQI
jgi:hypothetical protein